MTVTSARVSRSYSWASGAVESSPAPPAAKGVHEAQGRGLVMRSGNDATMKSAERLRLRRRPVAAEVELDLRDPPPLRIRRRKRPLPGRLDRKPAEIPACAPSLDRGGGDRAVAVDVDAHPHLDVAADGSTRAGRNVGDDF